MLNTYVYDILKIFDAVPGAASAARTVGEGFFTVPCDNIPTDIAIELGGVPFDISPDFLNLGEVTAGSNDCVAGIVGDEEGKMLHTARERLEADGRSRLLDSRRRFPRWRLCG